MSHLCTGMNVDFQVCCMSESVKKYRKRVCCFGNFNALISETKAPKDLEVLG